MTQREFFNAVITGTLTMKNGKTKDAEVTEKSIFEDSGSAIIKEMVDFAQEMIDKLDKVNEKRAGTKRTRKPDEETVELINKIKESLVQNEVYTAKALADKFGVSTQKTSSILRKFVDSGEMTQEEIKVDGENRKVKAYKLV